MWNSKSTTLLKTVLEIADDVQDIVEEASKGFDDFTRSIVKGYPPYNIIQLDEGRFQITIAVAGFEQDDLSIETTGNVLTISGKPSKKFDESTVKFIHRGLANRAFKFEYPLSEHLKFKKATHNNGLLTIDLAVEVPEPKTEKHSIG